MKKSLLYLVLIFSLISCTNYYTVLLQKDTPPYSSSNSETSTTVIPKGTEIYLSSKPNRKNYNRKIKWGNYCECANNPQHSTYSNSTKTSSYTSPTVSSGSSYNSGSSS